MRRCRFRKPANTELEPSGLGSQRTLAPRLNARSLDGDGPSRRGDGQPATNEVTNHVFTLMSIGHVSSSLVDREHAPKQGHEGAPESWLVFKPEFQEGLRDLGVGQEILVLTWLDRSDRETLHVHPRDDQSAPLHGVFITRSQDRRTPWGSIA